MAAPTKSFTVIADTRIDVDSPVTEDLMEDYRDNDIHLEEWLGGSYVAAVDHDHDGVNSAVIVLAEESVTGLNLDRTGFTYLQECIADTSDAFTNTSVNGGGTAQDAVGGTLRFTASVEYQHTRQKVFDLSSGDITTEFRIKSVSGGDTRITCGLSINTEGGGTDNVQFEYNTGTNKIACKTTSSSTSTNTDTSLDFSTSFMELKIVATSSQVLFYVDGSLEVTHTTDIPSVLMYGSFGMLSSVGSDADYDYGFYYQNTR